MTKDLNSMNHDKAENWNGYQELKFLFTKTIRKFPIHWCRTRGESEDSSVHKRQRIHASFENQGWHYTKSKQRYQWPHKKDWYPPFFKKSFNNSLVNNNYSDIFRFVIHLLDRWFYTDAAPPADWTHVVLNYLGPEAGEGIRVYYDGVTTGSDDTERLVTFPGGFGRVALGRLHR